MAASYKDLLYKPSIEDVVLEGDKTTDEFGLQWPLTAGKQMEISPLRPDYQREIWAINVENPVSMGDDIREQSPATTDLTLEYEDIEDPNIAKTKLYLKNAFALKGEEWTDGITTIKLKTEYGLDGACTISCEEMEYEPPGETINQKEIKYIEYIFGNGTKENPLTFDIEKFANDFLSWNLK